MPRFGERRTLYLGQFFGGLGMVLAGLARTGLWLLRLDPSDDALDNLGPAAQGMMTRRVSESEQGELQGAINSLRSLAWIIGPGLFTFTFAYFIDQKHGWNIPGAPWYLGAALLFLAMLMSTRIPPLPPGGNVSDDISTQPDVRSGGALSCRVAADRLGAWPSDQT